MKRVTVNDIRDRAGWTLDKWIKYIDKYPDTAKIIYDEYNSCKDNFSTNMEYYRLSQSKMNPQHLNIIWMTKAHIEDKEALCIEYPVILDKMLHIFWEEYIVEWFEWLIINTDWVIIQLTNMFLTEELLDEYISLKLNWEEAQTLYRKEFDKQQDTLTFTS